MAKRRAKRFGDVKRNKANVKRAALKNTPNGSKRFNVGVLVTREASGVGSQWAQSSGKYRATACILKAGELVAGSRNRPGRKNSRCAVGTGVSPTRAAKAALGKLTKSIK